MKRALKRGFASEVRYGRGKGALHLLQLITASEVIGDDRDKQRQRELATRPC